MELKCLLLAEIACEIQLVVAENGNISRAGQRHLIIDIADQMISDNLINEDSEDIDEIVSLHINDYLNGSLDLK